METKKHAIISLFSVILYLHRIPNRSWGIVGFSPFILVKDLDQVPMLRDMIDLSLVSMKCR